MRNLNKLDLRTWFVQHPNALFDEKTLLSILSDAFQNDLGNVNLLMAAFREDIVSSLRTSFPWNQSERNRFVKLLEHEHSIVSDRAIWAVNTWESLFSDQVINALDKYDNNLSNRRPKSISKPESISVSVDSSVNVHNTIRLRSEYDRLHIDPSLNKHADRIYIPCGLGNTDNGFFIYGIKKSENCHHPAADVYALVYNLLIRSSNIKKENIPRFLTDIESVYEIDYRSVFRIAITLLQMVKNNYAKGCFLDIDFSGDNESLKFAVKLINHYAALFSRLMRISEVNLAVRRNPSEVRFSLDGNNGIYVKNNTELMTIARELWYGRKLYYDFKEDSLSDLEYLLREISPFNYFLDGQFETLKRMISAKKHTVCIMPTGSGKSLIYYMISFLQPIPLIVISPTDILIKDQIRNLKRIHQIDNVAHLQLTSRSNYVEFEFYNSINFITPATLQYRNLLLNFKRINNGDIGRRPEHDVKRDQFSRSGNLLRLEEVSSRETGQPRSTMIILDEIHCISNWGHDFRPEYLMLSKYLNNYFDMITLLGFTATANYTVVEDVQKQLNIPQKNFLSPIVFEKNNITYQFRCLGSTQHMLEEVNKICELLISKKERTLIFTKSDEVSRKVANAVGYEADIFSVDNPEAYYHFADGKCLILVTSEDLGIGINLPNIRNVIHFGLPFSKSEYVQQIGRAGRANEQVVSYVLFLDSENKGNIPKALLSRDTPIEKIPDLLVGLNNDYSDIYRKITNNCPTMNFLLNELLSIRDNFSARGTYAFYEVYNNAEFIETMQKLYMLYVTGFIYDFYAHRESESGKGIEVIIKINASSREGLTDRLYRMKQRLCNYLEEMGSNRKSISKVNRANTEDKIIQAYVEWYYEKYLYHHHEQFLDLYDFITKRTSIFESEEITTDIKDYFNLPFIKLKSDEEKYSEMSIQQIADKVIVGVNTNDISNIERINSNRYSYKLDYFLFCANLRNKDIFETDRLQRILHNMPDQDRKVFINTFYKLFKVCSIKGRLSLMKFFVHYCDSHKINHSQLVDQLYANDTKDIVYFGFLAQKLNPKFSRSGGNKSV